MPRDSSGEASSTRPAGLGLLLAAVGGLTARPVGYEARLEWSGLAQVEAGHSAPIFGQVFPDPRLLLPGHPLDPCRAFRGAAPVGSATHSPDGCGPSDRLSACHGAVASPSQSRTCVGHGAPLGFGEPPLAIYPGVKSTDRRAARRHAELHLRRPAEEPAQALRRAVHFPQRALRPRSALGPPAGGAARRAGLSAKTDAWDMSFKGQAQDLARCSRLSGPSRLGSSESCGLQEARNFTPGLSALIGGAV